MLLIAMTLQAAVPAPVYLKCALDTDTSAGPMDVQLNEAAGTASYSFTVQGRTFSFTKPAVFTSDHVSFNGFTINRSNLSFSRETTGLLAETTGRSIDTGRCVVNNTKRAF